jgi:hypothetical protein
MLSGCFLTSLSAAAGHSLYIGLYANETQIEGRLYDLGGRRDV